MDNAEFDKAFPPLNKSTEQPTSSGVMSDTDFDSAFPTIVPKTTNVGGVEYDLESAPELGFSGTPLHRKLTKDVAKAQLTGASTPEVVKQIQKKYPELKSVVRPVDKSKYSLPDFSLADKEYFIVDPATQEIAILNRAGLSPADATSFGLSELPYALTAPFTGGTSMAWRAGKGAGLFAGTNLAQQYSNIGLGGREELDIPELATTTVLGGASDYIGEVLANTGTRVRNILGYGDQGESRALLERRRVAKQTPAGIVADVRDIRNVENVGDLPLTPAERSYDFNKGVVVSDQDKATRDLVNKEYGIELREPLLAEVKEERKQIAKDIVTRDILSNEQKLAMEKLATVRELEKQGEIGEEEIYKMIMGDIADGTYITPLRESTSPTTVGKITDSAFSDYKAHLETSASVQLPSTIETVDDEFLTALRQERDRLGKSVEQKYDWAREMGGRVPLTKDIIANKIITPDIRNVIDSLDATSPEVKQTVDTFMSKLTPKTTLGGDTVERNLNDIEEARKYLRDAVHSFKKESSTRHIGDELGKLFDAFDKNADTGFKELEIASDLFSDRVNTLKYKANIESARKVFADKAKKFGEKELLGKMVNAIDKGEISSGRVMNMLIMSSGKPKFGAEVVKKINSMNPQVKERLKQSILLKTFLNTKADSLQSAGLKTGQDIRTSWHAIRNTEIRKLFTKEEWTKISETAGKLQKMDVVQKNVKQGSRTGYIQKQSMEELLRVLGNNLSGLGMMRSVPILNQLFSDVRLRTRDSKEFTDYIKQTLYNVDEVPLKVTTDTTRAITAPLTTGLIPEQEQQSNKDIR